MKVLPLSLGLLSAGLLATGCSSAEPPNVTVVPATTTAPSTLATPVSTAKPMATAKSMATAKPAPSAKPTAKPTAKPAAKPTAKPVKAAPKPVQADKPDPNYIVTADPLAIYQGSLSPAEEKAVLATKVPPPPLNMKVAAKPRVVLQTNKGAITVELDAKEAPLHTKSFVYLSNRGFFNGTVFHRHADLTGDGQGYIIQGGDPLTKNAALAKLAGSGNPGYQIPRERNTLTHQQFVIAAARSSDPDSAGCQFYLTQNPVSFLDEGDGYTVFGKIVSGKDVALKLTQGDKLIRATVQK